MHSLRRFREQANYLSFCLTGKKPWTRGYGEYRIREISKIIDGGIFDSAALPKGYGYRLDERCIEYPWLFSVFSAERGKLLDAGSVLNHKFLLTRDQLKIKHLFISTLAPEPVSFNELGISYVYEDLRNSCFRDGFFDWIVCLSTLEHVGLDNTMLYTADRSRNENNPRAHLDAVRELRRLLRPGGKLYLSFPFGSAANHGWFQIFDAKMVDEVIDAFAPRDCVESHFRYLPDGWTVSSRNHSKDATYFDIHRSKTYEADFAAASRAVVCMELVK